MYILDYNKDYVHKLFQRKGITNQQYLRCLFEAIQLKTPGAGEWKTKFRFQHPLRSIVLRQNEPNSEGALFSLLRTENASQANFGRLALDCLELLDKMLHLLQGDIVTSGFM